MIDLTLDEDNTPSETKTHEESNFLMFNIFLIGVKS